MESWAGKQQQQNKLKQSMIQIDTTHSQSNRDHTMQVQIEYRYSSYTYHLYIHIHYHMRTIQTHMSHMDLDPLGKYSLPSGYLAYSLNMGPFLDDFLWFPYQQMLILHSYVQQPEGSHILW